MANSNRVGRVSDEIHKVLVQGLRKNIQDPRLKWVTITSVEISSDLSYAKVYYSFLENVVTKEEVDKAITKASGFLKRILAKNLQLRIVPKLTFIYDDSLIYGEKIESLIKKAKSSDRNLENKEEDNYKKDSNEKNISFEKLR